MKKQNRILLVSGLAMLLLFVNFSIDANASTSENLLESEKYSSNYNDLGKEGVVISFDSFVENDKDFNIKNLVTNCEPGGLPSLCCPYWDMKISWGFTGPTIECNTGGEFKCKEENEDGSCGSVEPE